MDAAHALRHARPCARSHTRNTSAGSIPAAANRTRHNAVLHVATVPPAVSREIAHSAVDAQLSRVGEDDADDSEVKESNLNESIAAKQAEKKEVEFKIAQVEQQIKERGRPGRMRSMISLRAYGHCGQFRSSACTASSNRWPRGSCGAPSAWLYPVGAGRARSAAQLPV